MASLNGPGQSLCKRSSGNWPGKKAHVSLLIMSPHGLRIRIASSAKAVSTLVTKGCKGATIIILLHRKVKLWEPMINDWHAPSKFKLSSGAISNLEDAEQSRTRRGNVSLAQVDSSCGEIKSEAQQSR